MSEDKRSDLPSPAIVGKAHPEGREITIKGRKAAKIKEREGHLVPVGQPGYRWIED